MVLNINFKGDAVFIGSLNKEVNGFINRCLGKENKYHGHFSNYCVSTMQGGKMNREGIISFSDGGNIQVSSYDVDFINDLVSGIVANSDNLSIGSLQFKSIDIDAFRPFKEYDIIRTISPLYISKDGKSLTFKDDNFLEVLTEKSRKKLIHNGLSERKANTLSFTLFHPEKAKTKMIEIGKQRNIGSQVMLYVKGDKAARTMIYELGLGKCTGFGFGAVTIIRKECLI